MDTSSGSSDWTGWVIVIGFFVAIGLIGWIAEKYDEWKRASTLKNQLQEENQKLREKIEEWENYLEDINERDDQLNKKEILFKRLFRERTKNFPVVGEIWSSLIALSDEEREKALRYKSRPAVRAADEIKAIKQEKRSLAKELVYWKYKSQNYESIYPWLAEELEQDIHDEAEEEIYYTVYTEKEREDPVTQFISPEDYRKLSPSERNERALNRYWQRGKKSKWMIGKMYERYIGYLYESQGWEVNYFGIHKRYEDLGRDLIAKKENKIHVVQCKNWSRFKTIYENHIFQLFGTTYGLKKEHSGKKVVPVFYASTSLSETAEEFAKLLGIDIHSNFKFQEYPCVKCHIGAAGEKIYHLPFDQQYDKTKIEISKGDFYAKTVHEAETKGFRRAFRWSGVKS